MPKFAWQGKTRDGKSKSGVIVASNRGAALAQLRNRAIVPVAVTDRAGSGAKSANITIFPSRVKTKELVTFTRQFATMIDAGLPLVQCLDIQAAQQERKVFRDVITDVKNEVEQGQTLANALEKQNKTFDELYTNLVRAGEVGGVLDTILNRLATYLEKAASLRSKVRGAMVYPTAVVLIAIGVIVLLLIEVIPVFEAMFTDVGATLPGPTLAIINLSRWLQEAILFLLGGVVAFVIAYRWARRRNPKFRYQTDAFYLKLPIFGTLIRKVAVARFCRTFSTMLSSGVPILDSLDICGKTSGNRVVERTLQEARSAISEGKTLAQPLQRSSVFGGMVSQMISVGEQTGSMDSMLSKLADFYDDEVDTAVAALTSLLEPLLIVFLGGAVGSILIAMYLPIFSIADTIR